MESDLGAGRRPCEHRRLVPDAAIRGRPARPRSGSDRRVPGRSAAARGRADEPDDMPLLRHSPDARLRGPRNVAARQLLPARGGARPDGALLSAQGARLRRVLPRAARGVRDAATSSSPTTPISRPTRARWLEHAQRYAEMAIERFGLGRDRRSWSSRATTGTCSSTSWSAAFPCWASSRPRTWREVAREKGVRDAREVLRARDGARGWRR